MQCIHVSTSCTVLLCNVTAPTVLRGPCIYSHHSAMHMQCKHHCSRCNDCESADGAAVFNHKQLLRNTLLPLARRAARVINRTTKTHGAQTAGRAVAFWLCNTTHAGAMQHLSTRACCAKPPMTDYSISMHKVINQCCLWTKLATTSCTGTQSAMGFYDAVMAVALHMKR